MASIDVIDSNTAVLTATTTTTTTAATTATTVESAATTADSATASTAATTADSAATVSKSGRKIITYREIRPDFLKVILLNLPTINLDDEIMQWLYFHLPPRTIREFKETGCYNDQSPDEIIAYFINDEKSREGGYILQIEDSHYTKSLSRKEKKNHYHFRGYTDEERRSINDDTPLTDDLEWAIIAASARMDRHWELPNTVGEWKQHGWACNFYKPQDALAVFINDESAREEGYIEISQYAPGHKRGSVYDFRFSKYTEKTDWNDFFRGYSDEERRLINDDTPMTEELEIAIIASTTRNPKKGHERF